MIGQPFISGDFVDLVPFCKSSLCQLRKEFREKNKTFDTHISPEKISLPAQDFVFGKETSPIVSIAPSRAHW